jgi:hypothetical protein
MVRIPALLLSGLTLCGAVTVIADSVISRVAANKRGSRGSVPNVWAEVRTFLWVALSVFTISVFAQLVFVRMMHPSFADFFARPIRTEMFLLTTSINLVNGFIAGYLALWAKYREHRWRARQREVSGYLNHHVRNALCSIQLAASTTDDPKTIQTCNESIKRIIDALKTADSGIPREDEFRRFQERMKVS